MKHIHIYKPVFSRRLGLMLFNNFKFTIAKGDMNYEKRYYLAYGSNLNLEQMRRRCPTAVKVGTAFIENYRLMFKGSGSGNYLTIEKENGHYVPVGVFIIQPKMSTRLIFAKVIRIFIIKRILK